MKSRLAPTKRVVSDQTVLCIEGFQRSANSFAVQAFHASNDPFYEAHVATHLHSPAHVKECLRRKIPCLVLIRKPRDCLLSWIALSLQLNKFPNALRRERDILIASKYWIQRYFSFYRELLPLRDVFFSATFDDVTADFSQVLKGINSKMGTSFSLFSHDERAVREIFSKSKVHLSPSCERERIKAQIKWVYESEDQAFLRNRADEIFHQFSNFAEADKQSFCR